VFVMREFQKIKLLFNIFLNGLSYSQDSPLIHMVGDGKQNKRIDNLEGKILYLLYLYGYSYTF
jgi:hypothetical protein